MTPETVQLAPIVWLVASQFLLYAVGWGLFSVLLHGERAAVAHWGGFMLLLGLGMVLAAQRGEPRTWWAYVGCNIVVTSSYVVLRRGLEFFSGLPRHEREHVLTLLVVMTAFMALGPAEQHAPWRVIVAYGLGAWVLLRTVMGLIPALRTELGPRLPWLLAAPALLLITVFCLRVVQQALDFERVFELHRLADSNRNLLFGYLAGAAMFNFSFMGLVTLRLTRRLREQSRHDALTGLPNRRVLEHELEREWQRLQRSGERFAVLALDLDHFKRVNDEHGHLAGDAVLSQIAQRVRQVVRQVDTAARTGGEEFVVLMPQGDLAGALAAAERVRAGVKAAPFELPEGQVALTISIGVALAEATDTDVRQVLQRADRALYRAKEAGRDRVMAD